MRFVYCAAAISFLLNDFSGVDIAAVMHYVQCCVSYEGGIALSPQGEAHGGSTYCALAAAELFGCQTQLRGAMFSPLLRWLQQRQSSGFNGRTNKDVDSCYSFWIGASLHIIGSFDMTDAEQATLFLLQQCQSYKHGGFSKTPSGPPDILHSFYSVCYLALAGALGEGGRKKRFNPIVAMCV